MIVTLMRKGRYEVSVFTNVGKSTTSTQDAAQAAQTALIVQGTALKASIPDLFVVPAKGDLPPRPLRAGRRPKN